MSKFKIGDKVVAASQKGTEVWLGLEVVDTYGEMVTCKITDPASKWDVGMKGAFAEDDLRLVTPKAKRDYVADHARRTLRAAGLSKTEAANFVSALAEAGQTWDVKLSQLSRKLPDRLSVVIRGAFSWADSVQGDDYWDNIVRREEEKEATANA